MLKGPCNSTNITPKVGDVALVKESLPRSYVVIFVNYSKVKMRESDQQELHLVQPTALSFLYPTECPDDIVSSTYLCR